MNKYSDKFLNQSFKLKNSLIGFEFEFYMKDLSFYKTLEMLNKELYPVKVWGFRNYHSDFTPDKDNFKIEPDLSGGNNLVELVTGPLDYFDAKYYLIKIINFIQNYGYTNDKCSIHFNLSFKDSDKNLNDLNILKLILNTDEDEVYNYFPSRKDNVYAKTIKKIIPYKEYDFFNIPIGVVKNNIRIPNDKYYGVNFLNINNDTNTQRLEFRYIGGKDYEKNPGQLIYFLDRFIINTWNSIDVGFSSEDIEKLQDYLEDNIKIFNNFSKYDNFIIDFPSIQLQIDQISNYDIVSSYYDKIFNKLYNLIDSTTDLKDCIINYVTNTQTIEIVDANIKASSTLKNYEFINCEINGIFESSTFLGCNVRDSQISKSTIEHTELIKTKLLSCKVDGSTLNNCFFMDGFLNSDMIGGIFRSGQLGPWATMDSDVKIVNDNENFFKTKWDDEDDKGDKKGKITGFGK
jgi:uncharacterized protein YjbI with pentapeptide repeats